MSFEFSDDQFLYLTEGMFKEKSKGNEHFKKGQLEEASICFKNAIETGEEYLKKLTTEQKIGLVQNSYYEKFISDLKFCYSNLAAVYLKQKKNKEVIEIDKYIISNFDRFFEKSYARLITVYEKLEDTTNAEKYYKLMMSLFSKEIVDTYKNQFKVSTKRKDYILSNNNERIHQEENTFIDNNGRNRIKITIFAKIILVTLVFILSYIGKKYILKFFFGTKDKTRTGDLIKYIPANMTIDKTPK